VAEASEVAFGTYLRQLRERRGLSLSRVCELSKSSPEAIDKGTLSRLEHGQQTPSIFRLGPLSRIYEISADALLERMELDREVDRLGGPETRGKSYDELHRAGGASVVRANRKWDAYAYFRDALPLAGADQRVGAWINLVTAIRALGKNALALHELRELETSVELDARQRALVHERMSNCSRCLGDMKHAEQLADLATAQAQELGDSRILAHAYSARAGAAIDQEQWKPAYDYLLKALAAYREGAGRQSLLLPSPSFEAQALLKLAECSLKLGNVSRTRRLTLAAKRMSEEHDLPVGLAYSELLLGWIDEGAGRVESALTRWRRAAVLAARIDYPRIAFTAEVEIFRQASQAGDVARARASRRRLERLAPWIPRHIPAYRRFKELTEQDRPRTSRTQEDKTHDELPKISSPGVRSGADAHIGRRSAHRQQPRAGAGHRVATDVR
jgi:transcriptional regulator with XRE-family HTH domain